MVTMRVLGSSSLGNSYILRVDNEVLLIEAGIRFNEVKKVLNWYLSNVVGCLVTHLHGDHSRYIPEVMKAGIPVFALQDTFRGLGVSLYYQREIMPKKGLKIGKYRVFPFEVRHDVPCVGFVIEHPAMGRLLFLTDTMMMEYTFDGLDHIMIEANYSDEILDKNIKAGIEPSEKKFRLMGSHMELGTALGILKANDLCSVKDITLIHLSALNSNGEVFKKRIESETGIPTYIATPGLVVNMAKNYSY